MKILPDSWEAVTKETVINCFKKAEINSDVQEAAIADSDDSFKDLQKKLNELKSADPSMVPKDVSQKSIVSLGNHVIATTLEITESNIIEQLCLSQQAELEEDENDNDLENSIEELFDHSQEKPS